MKIQQSGDNRKEQHFSCCFISVKVTVTNFEGHAKGGWCVNEWVFIWDRQSVKAAGGLEKMLRDNGIKKTRQTERAEKATDIITWALFLWDFPPHTTHHQNLIFLPF